ncbi:mannosyltransferase [Scheffersomyces coipomensis]|uniref:mannosyltransferase n=1 Tax=Scheffersomyces coipomensis TaxID=1788519 RepID=UPI00315CBECC
MIKLNTRLKASKLLLYVCIMIWILAFNVYIYCYHSESISDTIINIIDTTNQQLNSYKEDEDNSFESFSTQDVPSNVHKTLDASILELTPIKLYHQQYLNDSRNLPPSFSQNYETMFNLIDSKSDSPDFYHILSNLDFSNRCQLYFENLFVNNQNWFINPFERISANRFNYEYDYWRRNNYRFLQKQYNKQHRNDEDREIQNQEEFDQFIKDKYKEFMLFISIDEQKSLNFLSHLRIFNKCYLSVNNIKQQNSIKSFLQHQKHFVKIAPTLELKEDEVKHNENQDQKENDNKNEDNNNNKNDNENINNKIRKKSVKLNPASDCSFLEQRLYPWLSFHYPVFEKWTGEIELSPPKFKNSNAAKTNPSTESQYGSCFLNKFRKSLSGKGIVLTIGDKHVDDTINLIALLRALQNTLPIQIVYYDNLSGNSKSRIVRAAREVRRDMPESFDQVRDQFSNDYDRGLPKQEVYFVNTYSVIHENYKSKFDGYGNKLLATVFNTFEEFILIDADSVLLKNPEWFFQNNKYKSSGALFYKDRTTMQIRPPSDAYFFKKMSPSVLDAIIFDIPLITSKTLELDAMQGMFHFMEAGVVVIDKTRHFNSILLLPQLNFMEAFRDRSHGEKELFWLSFIVNGDEDFTFNKYHAAAAGQASGEKIKLNGQIRISKEICSAHPAHVDDETNELIWFNSGFHFCGKYDKVDYKKDLESQGGRYKPGITTVEELRSYYFDPIQIETVIIPPFNGKDNLFVPNGENEPSRSWDMIGGLCDGYVWCAYSDIGSKDRTQSGTVIEIDEQDQKLFQFYGDIWVGNE